MIDDILLNSNIQRPGRYIGREWNVSRKSFDQARVRFALCFPDLYEVGMSNLGIRIIYGILNAMDGVTCERFFSCGRDLEDALRAKDEPLFSLESGRGLRDFDLAGFSLGYELCYTNILAMLSLAGIPLRASERSPLDPLVIGGGPCVLNPEPLHEFFDAFLIGEAEEALPEVIAAYAPLKESFRSGVISRAAVLERLAAIEGVYVPSLYNVEYAADGKIAQFTPLSASAPARVRKRVVGNLDSAYFPAQWLVPYLQTVHDRVSIEIARGCPNRCRFCQARQQYYPLRLRSPQTVLRLAEESFRKTGYEEIALAGLSVSDYPGIEELMSCLIGAFKRKGVGISLPSIKPKDLVGSLSSQIASIKKTGLTFAPEAATAELRKTLHKDFLVDEFFGAIDEAFRSGYQRVKLYFMINLPGETRQDLDAILDFAASVSNARRKIAG
ncbi:MAG: TIGR03960 family B12-binding radical SAM protein, partial [Candidatus Omnitrophica bacterium]|nr:TIGR03960 family B12-binding radical SAM protein [Candidatus Omnitrophota bacterium]